MSDDKGVSDLPEPYTYDGKQPWCVTCQTHGCKSPNGHEYWPDFPHGEMPLSTLVAFTEWWN